MLLWCDNSWTVYQTPNLIRSKKLKSGWLHYNICIRIKPLHWWAQRSSLLLVQREASPQGFHITLQASIYRSCYVESIKMIFSVSPPVQSTIVQSRPPQRHSQTIHYLTQLDYLLDNCIRLHGLGCLVTIILSNWEPDSVYCLFISAVLSVF